VVVVRGGVLEEVLQHPLLFVLCVHVCMACQCGYTLVGCCEYGPEAAVILVFVPCFCLDHILKPCC
jgi:hypothetical protein